MEKETPLPMTPFDMQITSSSLQMMKLMLPYIPASYQQIFACYIKFLELKSTIRYFHNLSRVKQTFSKSLSSPTDIIEDLRPYMGKDADTMDMILNAMNMMEMMDGMEMPDLSGFGDLGAMMDIMNQKGTDANE